MKIETAKEILEERVCLNLPEEIVADLGRIASFNETAVEKLIYSYIVEGIAGDDLIRKRIKFTDKTNALLSKFHVPPKTVADIAELTF